MFFGLNFGKSNLGIFMNLLKSSLSFANIKNSIALLKTHLTFLQKYQISIRIYFWENLFISKKGV